jgi:hypothetical protein
MDICVEETVPEFYLNFGRDEAVTDDVLMLVPVGIVPSILGLFSLCSTTEYLYNHIHSS